MVGMTGVPEVVLAREMGLCYAAIALVTNYGAGLSSQPLTHEDVVECQRANAENLRALLENALPRLKGKAGCQQCRKPDPMLSEAWRNMQPIKWEEGRLLLIDQTRLPHQEDWLSCTSYREAEAIKTMQVRGPRP